MDAVKYLKERERWYKEYGIDEENYPRPHTEIKDPEQAVKAVEQWSREHPVMTNAQKFEEVFGFNPCGRDNVPTPKWWLQPYKEPEKEAST